jgi:hypothetical protein
LISHVGFERASLVEEAAGRGAGAGARKTLLGRDCDMYSAGELPPGAGACPGTIPPATGVRYGAVAGPGSGRGGYSILEAGGDAAICVGTCAKVVYGG